MKTLIFAAALGISSVALAQTADDTQATGTEETTAGQTTGTEGTATTTTTDTSMQTSTSTGGTMSGGGGTVAPGNDNPERDARGIPVVSDPAQAPAGANASVAITPGAQVVVNPNQSAAFATQPSNESYQPCTRTVTDNCVQTYERGRPR